MDTTKITITHVFKTYFPNTQGGLEEAIRQIGRYSVKNGYKVNVISVSKQPTQLALDGINCKSYYHNIGSNSSPVSFDLIRNFNKLINETDILHLQYPWPTGELLTLFSNVKKPIVVTFHCDIHNRWLLRTVYTPFIKTLFKKVKVIVPTSENLLNSSKILMPFKEKCIPVNLWLDKERFAKLDEPSNSFIQEVSRLNDFCLFVGVLRWYKGLHVLLEAAKNIKGNIVIVGKGPLYDELNNKIKANQIKNVFLLGYQSDTNVSYLMQKSRFIILPSTSPAEAFGQILLEASYFSKPMLTTELGTGTSYVNLDGETGYVVKPNDVDSLIQKANDLFRDNKLCHLFGSSAFERYSNNFTEEVQGPKYLNIYKSLL